MVKNYATWDMKVSWPCPILLDCFELSEPRSTEGTIKSPMSASLSVCLSVCLSVGPSVRPSVCQFEIFLRNSLLFFSDFLDSDGWFKYFKTDSTFFQEKSFLPKFGKKGPKMSSAFPGNNLKWKLILVLIFHHQALICQNSDSQVMGQNAVGQWNCKIL